METPDHIPCEHCGAVAPVVMVTSQTGVGPMQWPKSTMRHDGFYVFVNCPQCGEQEQCVASADED